MAFITGSLWGREHRNVSLSPAPIIVSGDYFYMGSPAGYNQSRAPETQKEKWVFDAAMPSRRQSSEHLFRRIMPAV
jgi:hypothetical protein